MEQHFTKIDYEKDDDIEGVLRLFKLISRRWHYILASCIIALFVGWIINKYTNPVFQVNASIRIIGDIENPSVTKILYGRENFYSNSNFSNEVYKLASRDFLEKVLHKLDFGIQYFKTEGVRKTEIYRSTPVRVDILEDKNDIPYGVLFEVFPLKDNKFRINSNDNYWAEYFKTKEFRFGNPFLLGETTIKIILTRREVFPVEFKFVHKSELLSSYKGKLDVSAVKKANGILLLSVVGVNKNKEKLFLRKLIETYLEENIKQKNETGYKTIDFINEQLNQTADSLAQIENELDIFKEDNRGVSVDRNASLLYADFRELKEQESQMNVNEKYLSYLQQYVENAGHQQDLVVPTTVGFSDPLLDKLISDYVQSQTELKRYENSEVENPTVDILRKRMREVQRGIGESIKSLKKSNEISLEDLKERIVELEKSLKVLPDVERKLINIERLYGLNENIYLLLMNKKTEVAISIASRAPDFRVIDVPHAVDEAVSPKKVRNYMVCLALGFITPIGLIILINLINDKVISKEQVVKITGLPFLGIIGHGKKTKKIFLNPKSSIIESFRVVNTNLGYLLDNSQENKTIIVTSSISGEGKSFCSINLAYTVALSGKKTLLIGGDLRKPYLFENFGLPQENGLSDYLTDSNTKLDDIIYPVNSFEQGNLDIIIAGKVPQHPAELFLSERMNILMKSLKKTYDYIVIDTPPHGVVSDVNHLFKYADASIFIVRSNYTPTSFLKEIKEAMSLRKVNNLVMLLNDVNLKTLSNYKYSYGYYEDN